MVFLGDDDARETNNTDLGEMDFVKIQTTVIEQTKMSGYIKWTGEDRFTIGKFAAENGTAKWLDGDPTKTGLYEMVQTYIHGLSSRGAVITWAVANAAVKALMKKYPGVIGEIDVDSSYWAQSLFRRMGFTKRRKTLTKVSLFTVAFRSSVRLFRNYLKNHPLVFSECLPEVIYP